MRIVAWVVRFAVFLVILGFAAKNTDPVLVRFYLGSQWEVPLVFVLLVAYVLGVATGLIAGLGKMLRQRRESVRLRKQLRAHSSEEAR
jgi:putative membrane protein